MLSSFRPDDALAQVLRDLGANEMTISLAIDSGYYLRSWAAGLEGKSYQTVSDLMYGNKLPSSHLDIKAFTRYLQGENSFDAAPPFKEFNVRDVADIKEVLSDRRRRHYIEEGSLTFRGQWREFRLRRPIPNPVRRAADGTELSILPGAFRQTGMEYRFSVPRPEMFSIGPLVSRFEPRDSGTFVTSELAYDTMRVEQHYASPTAGLDLTFDVSIALFFATHKFTLNSGIANMHRISRGDHEGVIYCFRFGSPSVTKSQYYIDSFDLFRTYRPERITRQHCGLPLIGDFERNIAVTEIDCILRLDPGFHCSSLPTPEHLFPPVSEDAFYEKLLELKRKLPDDLKEVVEYQWARG